MIGFLKLLLKLLNFFYQLIKAGKTLSEKRWRASFTDEGCLDIGKCLSRIYHGVSSLHLSSNLFSDTMMRRVFSLLQ